MRFLGAVRASSPHRDSAPGRLQAPDFDDDDEPQDARNPDGRIMLATRPLWASISLRSATRPGPNERRRASMTSSVSAQPASEPEHVRHERRRRW